MLPHGAPLPVRSQVQGPCVATLTVHGSTTHLTAYLRELTYFGYWDANLPRLTPILRRHSIHLVKL